MDRVDETPYPGHRVVSLDRRSLLADQAPYLLLVPVPRPEITEGTVLVQASLWFEQDPVAGVDVVARPADFSMILFLEWIKDLAVTRLLHLEDVLEFPSLIPDSVGIHAEPGEGAHALQAPRDGRFQRVLVTPVVLEQQVPMDDVGTIDLDGPVTADTLLGQFFEELLEVPVDKFRVTRGQKVDVAEVREPAAEHAVVAKDGFQALAG